MHATSWWNAAAASSNLRDPSQPIWVSLTQAHKELYREIQTVQLGSSAALEQHFGEDCMLLVLRAGARRCSTVSNAQWNFAAQALCDWAHSTCRHLWAFLGAAVPVLAWRAAADGDPRSLLTAPCRVPAAWQERQCDLTAACQDHLSASCLCTTNSKSPLGVRQHCTAPHQILHRPSNQSGSIATRMSRAELDCDVHRSYCGNSADGAVVSPNSARPALICTYVLLVLARLLPPCLLPTRL